MPSQRITSVTAFKYVLLPKLLAVLSVVKSLKLPVGGLGVLFWMVCYRMVCSMFILKLSRLMKKFS